MTDITNDINQLQNLFNKKEFNKIEQLSKSLLIKHNGSFDINLIIGVSYLANKNLNVALDLLLKANKINSASSICLLNIAICYKKLNNINKYKTYLDLAYFSAPENIDIICELGLFYLNVNEIQLSISYYEKVIEYKNTDLNFVLNISQSYIRAGNSNKVIEICLYFIKHGNNNSFVFNTLAIAYKNIGDFKKAKLYFYKSIKLTPNYFQAHRNLSSLITYTVEHAHLIEMQLLYKDHNNNVDLNFALSKAYKDINEKQKCFTHLEFANKTIKKQLNYKVKEDEINFSRIKLIFSNPNLKKIFFDDQILSPIFILGLPRSGTTLVENIISSHSTVHAAGELDILQNWGQQRLINNNNSPITEDDILKCRQYYLKNISNLDKNILHITDKMPLNFLWIGLIFNCFPDAKVIHLIRNPVATCWSLFNTYFSAHGNSFSYSQSDIFEYYNLYLDLMKDWESIYPNKF